MRKLVERVCRNRVIKRSFLVGRRKVPIFVSPDAQLKYLKPGTQSFDQDLVRIAEKCLKPDSCVSWNKKCVAGALGHILS